jgi:hypothetical protein
MRPSSRALFLIVAASVVLHISAVNTLAILIGYLAFERLDWWLAKRARARKFDGIIFEWDQSKEHPEEEVKGNLSRIRLTGQNQIITARIADLLREMF